MPKITFIGAGSTVFAENVLGDIMYQPSLHNAHIALYDINAERLEDSKRMINVINTNCNEDRATITAHLGVENRKEALRNADYIINAIQVGGYEPCTVTDFEVPKQYGLRQTIADTIGIGGIFRNLRTIPVMLDIAHDIEEVCPRAWLLNYTNPMCAITSSMLRGSTVHTVGLCHSVQGCTSGLLRMLRLNDKYPIDEVRWEIAGINHQAWLLRCEHKGKNIYPEIKAVASERIDRLRSRGVPGQWIRELATRIGIPEDEPCYSIGERAREAAEESKISQEEAEDASVAGDLVRLELMFRFGYYITESSEHNSEYAPWFIKQSHPDLINHFNIPLDEYPRRCRRHIKGWTRRREELINNPSLIHEPSREFASTIINSIETDIPSRIAGNVMNNDLITNLPRKACVEVPCLVDRNGVQPTHIGDLPEQCAAMNRTNVNTQILSVEAALTGKKDYIYQAAMLDPHTSADLSIDQIVNLCDDLIKAHGDWLPAFS